MKVVLLYCVCALSLYDCFNYSDYHTDSNIIYTPIDNSTSLDIIRDHLLALGRTLHERLKSFPVGRGDKFMNDFKLYNTNLKLFIDLAKEDPELAKPNVQLILNNKNYTHIIETDFCEEDMKDNFNWTNDNVQQFYKVRDVLNGLWINLHFIEWT